MSDFVTEWGVKSPWGCNPATSQESAARIVHNMRDAGHEAAIVWRGVTDWHYTFNDELAMQPVTTKEG
jgi:hypothetical protein